MVEIILTLTSLPVDLQGVVALLILATPFGIYAKFYKGFYARGFSKTTIMDEDSKISKIRGLFSSFFFKKLTFVIISPPPTGDLAQEKLKLESVIGRGYELIDIDRSNPRKMKITFVKNKKEKAFKERKSIFKMNFFYLGRTLLKKIRHYEKFCSCIISGMTGSGKTSLIQNMTQSLIFSGYKVYFFSVINDQIKGATNVHLLDQKKLLSAIDELKAILHQMEQDKSAQLKIYIWTDELADVIALSKNKDNPELKEFLKLLTRFVRLGRKNSVFLGVASQNILSSELDGSHGLSRGMFPLTIAFRPDSSIGFSNTFGDGSKEALLKLKDPGVFYMKNFRGEKLHLMTPIEIKE